MDEESNLIVDKVNQSVKVRDKKEKKRLTIPDPKKVRNLTQYRDMSDEEFDRVFAERFQNVGMDRETEARIVFKLGEFEKDYDLSEMLINDKLVLRSLAQSIIELEDLEVISSRLRQDYEQDKNLASFVASLDKINKSKSVLKQDISKMQDDLKITRKVRRSESEMKLDSFLEDLKSRARKFYEQKMLYIFCDNPKCNQLLGTVWVQNHSSKQNKVHFYCDKCGSSTNATLSEIYEKRKASNNVDLLAESMR